MNYKSLFTTALCGLILFGGNSSNLLAQHNRPGHHQPVKKVKPKAPYNGTRGQYPESSDRLLTDKDIEHQTPWGLKVMMNEIYARHGFVFTDATLRKHFRKEKWYKGRERRMRNIRLTRTEEQNIEFIRQHQPKAKN